MTQAPQSLHAAGGDRPPPGLADDLSRLARMPSEAIASFWQALGPCLADPQGQQTRQILDVFCSAFGLAEDDLGAAIKACRYLVEGSARQDLPAEMLAEDVERLCPDHPEIKMLLAAGYESLKPQLRNAIVAGALADHGKLLTGARWRVDLVDSADRGVRLRLPVVMLTFEYREGTETKRVTLQALPDMMGELKKICDQVLR